MNTENQIFIEIAYATPENQIILEQEIEYGINSREAVQQSEINLYFPSLDKDSCELGIFGKAIRDDYILANGDRIEIYRDLIADPKEVRKRRAAEGKRMKKGGGEEA